MGTPLAVLPQTTFGNPEPTLGGYRAAGPYAHPNDPVDIEKPKVLDEIGSFVWNQFMDAQRHRVQFINERLADCLRRRKGEYSPDLLGEIQKQGGSKRYHNITNTKIRAAKAWLQHVVCPPSEDALKNLASIIPTPIPDLGDDLKQQAVAAAKTYFQANPQELDPNNPMGWKVIQEVVGRIYDEMMDKQYADAAKKCERMERLIHDQLVDADFLEVLIDFIDQLCTYPVAILYGPYVETKPIATWRDGQYFVEHKHIPKFRITTSFDAYPTPNARSEKDGMFIDVITVNLSDLQKMKNVQGWKSDAIDSVLQDAGPTGATTIAPIGTRFDEPTRQDMENRSFIYTEGITLASGQGLNAWGPIQGALLRSWGMTAEDVPDESAYYEVNCVVIGAGHHCVKCIMNPDPMGRRPVHCGYFDRIFGTFWGQSLPEEMSDCQDGSNACIRNLENNLAFASGPMAWVDMNAVVGDEDVTQMFPFRVFQLNSKNMNGNRELMKFFQPTINADVLLSVSEYYQKQADDRVGIPRYAHGNADVGGAGDTASGMSMLMDIAAHGIRRLVTEVSAVVTAAIEMLYAWNMQYSDDPNVKGDAVVFPKGIMAAISKESMRMRHLEFLDRAQTPAALEIMGLEGLRGLYEAVAKDLDLDAAKIVPSEDELKQKLQEKMAQQAEMMAQQIAAGQGEAKEVPNA